MKNYTFTYDFGQRWGNCDVLMTAVSGHLTDAKFGDEYEKDWSNPPPESLFTAQVNVQVDGAPVCLLAPLLTRFLTSSRINRLLQITSLIRREELMHSLSGLIVTAKASTLAEKFGTRQ